MKEYKYTINGNKYEVTIAGIEDNIANVIVNGEEYKVEMEKEPEPEKKKVVVKPVAQPTPETQPATGHSAKVNLNNAVKSPLPGVITEIKVAVGDEVKAGDTVVVLEAMKMQSNYKVNSECIVKDILVNEGDSVNGNQTLILLEIINND